MIGPSRALPFPPRLRFVKKILGPRCGVPYSGSPSTQGHLTGFLDAIGGPLPRCFRNAVTPAFPVPVIYCPGLSASIAAIIMRLAVWESTGHASTNRAKSGSIRDSRAKEWTKGSGAVVLTPWQFAGTGERETGSTPVSRS
jgi:hypothetical protein